jgi:glutamate--cysteine ligase
MTTLKTASDAKIDVYNLDRQICKNNTETFDLVILNHDLSSGIPSCLEKIKLPIIPSLKAGWYNRSKTHHFKCTNEVIDEFASEFGIDPWFFTCLYETADAVTINDETDRIKLADKAKTLLARIQKKYDQYDIKSKPYLFLKSSQGTYGMGVQAIYDSSDILTLNRKNRNKLYKGKSSTIINNFILQEGVESALTVEDKSAEVCIYNIGSQSVGAFYRVNTKKSVRDNLNSSGMEFRKICPVAMKHPDCLPDTGDYCGIPLLHDKFFVYQVVSRLSLLASVKEVQELEMKS